MQSVVYHRPKPGASLAKTAQQIVFIGEAIWRITTVRTSLWNILLKLLCLLLPDGFFLWRIRLWRSASLHSADPHPEWLMNLKTELDKA